MTSYLFPDGQFSLERLQAVLQALGNDKNKLVIDLSCRRKGASWFVAMNKWQTITDMEIKRGMNFVAFATLTRLLIYLRLNIDARAILFGVSGACGG